MNPTAKKCLLVFSEESTATRYGVGTYIKQLIDCFDRSLWDINIITLNSNTNDVILEQKDGVSTYQIPHLQQVGGFWTSESEEIHLRGVYYYLAALFGEQKQLYCHFNFVAHQLALFMKEQLQAKIVFTLHYTNWSFDLLGDRALLERILANPVKPKEKGVANRFEREKVFMLTCCDSIIAIAQHSYDMLIELYEIPESKLVLIPNGLKDTYKEYNEKERASLRKKYGFLEHEKIIIFAGRLDLVKGITELIEAFKRLQTQYNDLRLIIAGDGNFKRCFESVTPCYSKITFTGFIPKEHLFELYAIANVGVTPSLHEEFGYAALEMMMNSLPVIAGDGTGLSEILDNGKYGMLVNMRNEDKIICLKKALEEWYIHIEEKNKFKELGRKRFFEMYTLNQFTHKIELLYQNIK